MIHAHRLWPPVLLVGAALLLTGTTAFAHLPLRPGSRAPQAVFLSGGRPVSLAAYHGRKVMLWLFSTWCPSCKAGLKTLPRKQKQFLAGHLHLIILENHDNGGYSGPSLSEMKNRYAKRILGAPNWTFGHAT